MLKLLPPSDSLDLAEPTTGFFVELHTADDAVVFRRILHPPIRDSVEVFSETGPDSITRRSIENPTGVFAVLVPPLREAPHLVLRSSTTEGPDKRFRSAELGRFDLTPYLPR